MSLLNSFYPGSYALYSGGSAGSAAAAAAAGGGGRGGPAYLTGVLPPHLPLTMAADYGTAAAAAALGMGLSLPSVGFPLLSAAHCGPAPHPDSPLLQVCASKAVSAACHTHKSPQNNNNNNTNNNNNNNRAGGHLTNFTIDEILGKKDDKCKGDVLSCGDHSNDVSNGPPEGRDPASPSQPEDCNPEDTDPNARFSWLQCTRYRPPKLPRVKRKDGVKKRKLGRNPRVPFTQHQVNTLEQKFQRTHYLSSVDVAELSAALNLTETRVKIWFQNRRARERRDRENSLQGGGSGGGGSGSGAGNGGGVGGQSAAGIGGHQSPALHPGQRPPPAGAALSPGSSPVGRGLAAWPLPTPPTASALAHFSHALHQHGSAFTPVSFSAY